MLLIGSDCSGMCTEAHALDLLGIPYTHLFAPRSGSLPFDASGPT